MDKHTESQPQPLVTVITATFNICKGGREAFFRQSVESVHAQTLGAIEHLVIDGASTDGTRELIAEYEARGWLRCISEPDKGIYDAMNKGLKLASGRYIAFLNSDDYWHDPKGLEASVERLEATGAAFSYAPCYVVKENGQYVLTREPELGGFINEMPFCHQTMLTRTELMRRMGGFDTEHYRIIGDFDLVTRILLSGGKAVYVPRIFTTYRLGGVSNDRDDEQRRQEVLSVYKRHYTPLIGERADSPLGKHNMPANLLMALSSCLHPSVFPLVCQFVQLPANLAPVQLMPSSKTTTKWKGPLGLPLLTHIVDAGGSGTHWKLFGFLPLLSSTSNRNRGALTLRTNYRLLGFLPLLTVKTRPGVSQKHLLFGCIPIAGVKHQS